MLVWLFIIVVQVACLQESSLPTNYQMNSVKERAKIRQQSLNQTRKNGMQDSNLLNSNSQKTQLTSQSSINKPSRLKASSELSEEKPKKLSKAEQAAPRRELQLRGIINYADRNMTSNYIRTQGDCNASAAFAAIAMYQATLRLRGFSGYAVDLSDQAALQCTQYYATSSSANDCTGLEITDVLNMLAQQGAPLLSYYPYISSTWGIQSGFNISEGACQPESRMMVGTGQVVSRPAMSNDQLKQLLSDYGPVVVKVWMGGNFLTLDYKSNFGGCIVSESALNHAVLLVGYDDDTSTWLIRNSFGVNWGIGGYARVPYGANCGITRGAYYINYTSYHENPRIYTNHEGLSAGQIAGIVIGCVVFVALVVLLIIFLVMRNRKKKIRKTKQAQKSAAARANKFQMRNYPQERMVDATPPSSSDFLTSQIPSRITSFPSGSTWQYRRTSTVYSGPAGSYPSSISEKPELTPPKFLSSGSAKSNQVDQRLRKLSLNHTDSTKNLGTSEPQS